MRGPGIAVLRQAPGEKLGKALHKIEHSPSPPSPPLFGSRAPSSRFLGEELRSSPHQERVFKGVPGHCARRTAPDAHLPLVSSFNSFVGYSWHSPHSLHCAGVQISRASRCSRPRPASAKDCIRAHRDSGGLTPCRDIRGVPVPTQKAHKTKTRSYAVCACTSSPRLLHGPTIFGLQAMQNLCTRYC